MTTRFASQIRKFALAALGLALGANALAADFTSSYKAGLTTYSIKGSEPNDTAKHPVFIFTVGTTEDYDNAQAMGAVAEMVAKGFVAAAVKYDTSLFGTCSQILAKAKYIYNSASTTSAVAMPGPLIEHSEPGPCSIACAAGRAVPSPMASTPPIDRRFSRLLRCRYSTIFVLRLRRVASP
jgi:hypothetical protein